MQDHDWVEYLRNPVGSLSQYSAQERTELLKQAMDQAPGWALQYVENYIEYIPEAQRSPLLIEATHKAPRRALADEAAYITYIPEAQRSALLINAMKQAPDQALLGANNYIQHIPQAQRGALLINAMKQEPETALRFTHNYIQHIPEAQRGPALIDAMKEAPWVALRYAYYYIDHIPERQRTPLLIDAMKEAPWVALRYAYYYIDHIPEAQRGALLINAMKQEPETALISASDYIDHIPEAQRGALLINAMKQEPETALISASDYIDHIPEPQRRTALQSAADALIENLDYIPVEVAPSETLSYLHQSQIDQFDALSQKRQNALDTGLLLNRDHDLSDQERFSHLDGMSAAELGELMVLGKEELFTSSYLGTFKRFVERFEQEGHQSVVDIYDQDYANSAAAIFLEQAVRYNCLDQALKLIPETDFECVLNGFKCRMENQKFSSAISFSETIKALPDKSPVKQKMIDFIEEQHNQSNDIAVANAYVVTAAYCNTIAGEKLINIDGADNVSVPDLSALSQEDILGRDGVNRQLLVFTDDEDGQNSFAHFVQQYSGRDAYKIEMKEEYIKITSQGGSYPVEIYANKPAFPVETLIKDITKSQIAGVEEAGFDVVIHRGHSYNLDNTMPYFSSNNALMFLGSCGGYDNVDALLKISPNAHIISTTQTGTMNVNDPLLYNISENIRLNGSLDWDDNQTYLDSLYSSDKDHYLLPHKNTALSMQAAYNSVMQQSKDQMQPTPAAVLNGDDNENYFDLREHSNAIINDFETYFAGLDWLMGEDGIVVGNDVRSVEIERVGADAHLRFKDEAGNILEDYRAVLKNFDGDLDDIDIYQMDKDGDLDNISTDHIKIIEAPSEQASEKSIKVGFKNAAEHNITEQKQFALNDVAYDTPKC